MEIKDIYSRYLECAAVSTDTRQISEGTMFFALKGGNFNGNEFAAQALEKGAKYAVIDEEKFNTDSRFILVTDVLTSLQELANFHRRQLDIPVIAVTGSNGKTTSKELIHAVLSKKYKTYATKGNLNNHIGIPLTLLAVKKDVQIAIVEMGANHQKEILSYCKIAEPTHGTITNIGKAHLEGFGGFEGVKKGKGELYDYLTETKGIVFLNTNHEILKSILKISSPVTYPNKEDYYHCELIGASPFVKFKSENNQVVDTQLIGAYNFDNIAMALCIGKFFTVSEEEATKAVASYDPKNNRSEILQKGNITIIMDAYNANPSSMKAAIENFAQMKAKNKVLILGDMFELGEESKAEHKSLGKLISNYSFKQVLLCGKEMEEAESELKKSEYFKNKKELEEYIRKNQYNNHTILLKGSRGMGLETLLKCFPDK